MKKIRKILVSLSVLGLGLYLMVILGFYLYQERLLFYPKSRPFEQCDHPKIKESRLISTQYDSQSIRMILHETPGAKGWVVFFHGNASSACTNLHYADVFAPLSLNFAAIEYPGYEGDSGLPSQKRILPNVLAAVRYLKATQPQGTPFFFYGKSLGTGIAIHTSTKFHPQGLILEAPYTSISDVAWDQYPFLPIQWINKNPFHASSWAKSIRTPVLMFHGTEDATIRLYISKNLHQSFLEHHPEAEQVHFEEIDGAGHDDIPTFDRTRYLNRIESWIAPLLNLG